MNLSRQFILRPVATTLLMAAILLAGAVAYKQLPVSALPQVDYPTIQVLTFYPGASPDVMASSVTAPLERQFGQMPGLQQMSSTSSGGSSVITLQFSLDLSLDVAEQEVQAAINAGFNFLPKDLPNPPVYSKVNPADAPILTLALTSKTMTLPQVEDLADTRLAQKISQLPGVGLVRISGGQRPAVRVQANPTALASYGLTLEDLRTVIGAANVNQAKGGFDGPRQAAIIGANDQLLSSQEYKPLILAYRNGAPVRLSDVADVVDDAENVNQAAWMNESPAVIVNIQRQPGANVIEVVDRVKKLMPQLRSSLPSAVDISILTDRTTTIRASVWDVQIELMLAVALVVMVIFLFLRNLPATAIPSIAVPLSLVGTFGAMYLLGFSLNNLTLMALTISTGFVVDDAIVMIENVARYIEAGDSPLEAALKGSEQIGFTILSLTVSLIAVLIPLLFMGDVVGRLFREFAVTLGVTILLSAVVSLTLTPMMCAKLLKHVPEEKQGRFYRASQRVFDRTIEGYGKTLKWVLGHQTATLLIAVGTLVFTIFLYIVVPKGFFPVQDTGAILGVSEAPQSISFTAMAKRQEALAGIILKDPAVASLSSFIGVDGTNASLNTRADPDQPQAPGRSGRERDRGHPSPAAGTGTARRDHAVPAAGPGPFGRGPREPYAIPVHAGGSRSRPSFPAWSPRWSTGCAPFPNCATSAATCRTRGCAPRWRSTAPRLRGFGITPQMIDDTLYDAFGQRQVSTIFTQLNQYRVVLGVKPDFQDHPSDLDAIYLRGANGGQVPLSAIARYFRNDGAARHQPPGAVPRGHAFVQPGAGRFAGAGLEGDRRGHGADEAPRKHPGRLPGNGRRLPFLAVQRAAADPGGAGDGLHRAGGAVRKLHPPGHHPVHAAVGRRRGDPGAAAVPHGVHRHLADRPHPADRHREEERDHDDRLRPGGRAQGGEGAGRGDLPGVPDPLPPDHDDHHGGASGRAAAGAGARGGVGASAPARHLHRGRAHPQPGAHAVHDPGHLPLVRPPVEAASRSSPGRALRGTAAPVRRRN